MILSREFLRSERSMVFSHAVPPPNGNPLTLCRRTCTARTRWAWAKIELYFLPPPLRKSVLRAVLAKMQFTLHATRRTPHGASRLGQAMSAWFVKTRRAPSRHRRDARVHGHTTTAMHEYRVHPPPPPALPPACVPHNKPWPGGQTPC